MCILCKTQCIILFRTTPLKLQDMNGLSCITAKLQARPNVCNLITKLHPTIHILYKLNQSI